MLRLEVEVALKSVAGRQTRLRLKLPLVERAGPKIWGKARSPGPNVFPKHL